MRSILITTLILGLLSAAVPFVLPHLLMPNRISGTHAATESDCLACHEPWQSPSVARCLNCHQDLTARRGTGAGVHGGTEACIACHSEHHGLDHDTRGLDPHTFDHTRTGFWLLPHHKNVGCEQCHGDAGVYRGLSPACLSCHRDWQYGGYDHSKTGFPLSRFHRNLDCTRCHERGRGLAAGPHQTCADCHGLWTPDNFNHNVTGFALIGSRKRMSCNACHKSADYTGLDHECTGCPW